MANQSAAATVWNCPNYTGVLYKIGNTRTPFLNMIGGLNGGNTRYVGDQQFSLNVNYALNAAAQSAITETTSLDVGPHWFRR